MDVLTDAGDQIAAEEAKLVAQIAAGDTEAPVAELYRRYGTRLYRFGVQHLGNEGLAEEMVQETFVRLWRTAGRFDAGKAQVGTYLYVIARSVAADIRKRPSSRPLLPADDADVPPMPDSVDQILNSMIVREALEALGPAHADVIRLAHDEGLTQPQIAERLGLPLGTVKTRTFHGMRALRAALIERSFGPRGTMERSAGLLPRPRPPGPPRCLTPVASS
jgi:RNA polymerase sigma-70 factor, ECF subfamily